MFIDNKYTKYKLLIVLKMIGSQDNFYREYNLLLEQC